MDLRESVEIAHLLFDVPYEKIDIVVHPSSIVHSFVEFRDGSTMAQMGQPSMEVPILYALSIPLFGSTLPCPTNRSGCCFSALRDTSPPMPISPISTPCLSISLRVSETGSSELP